MEDGVPDTAESVVAAEGREQGKCAEELDEDLGDVGTYSYIPKKYHEKLASEMGRIYVGTFYPSRLVKTEYKAQQAGAALGHALAIADYTEGFTYYFGSGWSLNAQHTIDSLAAWERLLERSVRAARAPMKVTVR